MSEYNIMKQALGEQWHSLPRALQAHYQDEDNMDIGKLSIEYPAWMQWFLNVLHLFGALLNKKGYEIPAEVRKTMQDNTQYWHRTLSFADGKKIVFKSRWQYAGDNKMVEYVNPLLGLCMSVEVKEEKLLYQGEYFVLRLGKLKLPIPEWMLLGHTTIVEEEVGAEQFAMDFMLTHPIFGQIYRYAGVFKTVPHSVKG